MPFATGMQHRLYLKQSGFLRQPAFDEILPVNFNYQDLIMVSSGIVEDQGQFIVFQTYSCGCGPQPLIRGAFLVQEVAWERSTFRRLLAVADNPKDRDLANQKLFASVQRIRPARSAAEKAQIERALQGLLGETKKISFF